MTCTEYPGRHQEDKHPAALRWDTKQPLIDALSHLAIERHPDSAGGSDAAMSELNVALAEPERDLGS